MPKFVCELLEKWNKPKDCEHTYKKEERMQAV